MFPSLKPSQRAAIVGAINPQSATTAKSTGWVDASKFQNFLAVISTGAITATGLVDAKIEQAKTSSGGSAKDVTGKAITQLVSSTNDNNQCVINLKQDDLDVTNDFNYVRLTITPSVAAALISGELWGYDPRYGPADTLAATSVAQTV